MNFFAKFYPKEGLKMKMRNFVSLRNFLVTYLQFLPLCWTKWRVMYELWRLHSVLFRELDRTCRLLPLFRTSVFCRVDTNSTLSLSLSLSLSLCTHTDATWLPSLPSNSTISFFVTFKNQVTSFSFISSSISLLRFYFVLLWSFSVNQMSRA